MPYDRLQRRLTESGSPTVTTLPDGSIDHFCTVAEDAAGSLETRDAFGREILGDRSSLSFAVETTEPGGQAVNTAKQLHALGGSVTCYGHLDAPIFESLPFATVSMGAPAIVYVFGFSDRDVMFVETSEVAEWTLAELRRVGDLSDVFGGDAVCCSNWSSVKGLGSAFHRLSDADAPRVPFVFDPGDIVGCRSDEVADLLDAVTALQDTFDVVYSANRQEVRTTAAPLSGPFDDDLARLAAIREETGITAAAMHARDEAVAVTCDDRLRVSNYGVERPVRHTGGGDRFTGGLGHALACGWEWDVALACGNACAVYYVESGSTGGPKDIAAFLDEQPPVES
ncbi:carbohydrate kinase family protein [Halorubrum salsamenti]|uniref:carbohydrate kinase family protein n=1 Tax=Halorubrum salsamenti TaxID=2583990 RepID=UPI0011A2BED2|nr:carbohydrate kinase family protein [Halorubrum salsamenti]